MKTLADCKPSEFLRQTNRIRRAVEKWLTDTDILNIRKRMAVLEPVDKNASEDKQEEVRTRNMNAVRAQARENLRAILDAVLEDHPEETLEVLALLCFIEPEDADNHSVSEYLTAFSKLISDEAVIGFFMSLGQLEQMGISGSAKA